MIIKAHQFIEALRCVSHAMADKPDPRFNLHGVHLNFSAGRLEMVATDGRRTAWVEFSEEIPQLGLALPFGGVVLARNDVLKTLKVGKVRKAERESLDLLLRYDAERRSLFVDFHDTGDTYRSIQLLAITTQDDKPAPYPNWRASQSRISGEYGEVGACLIYLQEAAKALACVANQKYHGVRMKAKASASCGFVHLHAPACPNDFYQLAEANVFLMGMRI